MGSTAKKHAAWPRDAGAHEPVGEGERPPERVARLQRELLDDGPPTCIADSTGRLLYANAAYERIADALAAAGFAPTELEAREVSVKVGGRMRRFTLRRKTLRGDGRDFATAVVLEPLSGPGTARAALAAALERLDDITRLVSDWVWETNRDLVFTFVSPRVNEVLGYHQVELTGRTLTDLPLQPNAVLDALATASGRKPFRGVEVEIADRKGEVRHFLLSGLPVYCPASGDFLGLRGTAHDVTEAKRREEAMLKAKETAELANRAKGEFLANMSHELRTPLNAIIGFSELMSGEILGSLGNDQYKGYANDITDSARHLLELINEILDAAKIEAGHMTLAEEIVNPVAVLESVQRLMTPRAERAGLTLEARADPDLPSLYADRTKLKQILINLTSNAVKFTRPGGRVELRAELSETGAFLFVVSDTGIGIEAADIPRALAPFGQVDSRLNRKFEGTGLGLPMAKSLSELHGGTFDLVSRPNVGSTATVRLPAERVLRG
ncbi:MAG: ATP-binding protein [Kiloniellaceae bacterium]